MTQVVGCARRSGCGLRAGRRQLLPWDYFWVARHPLTKTRYLLLSNACQAIQIGDKRPRSCQCQKSFPCPAHQLARATISLPLVCSGTWVQSWVQLTGHFQCAFRTCSHPPDHALPGTGNARLSLGVTDIGQATHELKARGVATTPVKEEPGGCFRISKIQTATNFAFGRVCNRDIAAEGQRQEILPI